MSADGSKLPDFPSDIASLLADGRRLEVPPAEVRTRLRARLASRLPPPGGGGGSTLPKAPAAPWSRAPWWLVAAAFVVGLGGGRLSKPAPEAASEGANETRATTAPQEAATSARGAPVDVPSVAVAELPAMTTVARPRPSASAPPAPMGDLAAERRILAVARTALGRNDAADALAACEQHAARFPRALLAEEREAIAVQALVLGHRWDDAKARGTRFQSTYPKSILLPVVVAALEEEK